MKTRLAFLHTSPPAIAPLMQYYGREAQEFGIVNLLDDGILHHFRSGDEAAAESALGELLDRACASYGVKAALVTCSSVSRSMLESLQRRSPVPLLKVDVPMAEEAMRRGKRIGVAYTFAPTLGPTTALFESRAELHPLWIPGAYDALLAGNPEVHDRLMLEGLEKLRQLDTDVIVLAQVSMARVLPQLRRDFEVPVLSSLETSLRALREVLA